VRNPDIDSFADEMEKIAIGNITGSAATLGTIGALGGGYAGYQKARGEGAGVGDSLLSAGKGALIGGAAGGVTGAGLAAGNKALGGTWDKSISDFGRRQVHNVTGYVPEGVRGAGNTTARVNYLRNIGVGGGSGTQLDLLAAKRHLADVTEGRSTSRWVPKPIRVASAKVNEFRAKHLADANEKLLQHGATSIPGTIKAMASPESRKAIAGAVGKEALLGGGALGTLGLAANAHQVYQGVAGDVPEGETRAGNLARTAGSMAGMLVPGTLGLPVGMLANTALSSGGNHLAGMLQRKTHDPTDPTAPESGQLGHSSTMSASASGKAYGGGFEQ
jgi:hypothetical protein